MYTILLDNFSYSCLKEKNLFRVKIDKNTSSVNHVTIDIEWAGCRLYDGKKNLIKVQLPQVMIIDSVLFFLSNTCNDFVMKVFYIAQNILNYRSILRF